MRKINLQNPEFLRASDYIAFLSWNSEDKMILTYRYIYDTYDYIKKDILIARDGKERFPLEELENRLTRKLNKFTDWVSDGCDWDMWHFTQKQASDGVKTDAYRKYEMCIDSEKMEEGHTGIDGNIIDRLEIQYQVKIIANMIGAWNVELYLWLAKLTRALTPAERKQKERLLKKAKELA